MAWESGAILWRGKKGQERRERVEKKHRNMMPTSLSTAGNDQVCDKVRNTLHVLVTSIVHMYMYST